MCLAYRKSDLTRLLRGMLKTVVLNRPSKFRSRSQVAVGSEVSANMDEMSKAGLMSGLEECCRTAICDETDMIFADVGLFLTNSACRTSNEMNCRSGFYSELTSYLLLYNSSCYDII